MDVALTLGGYTFSDFEVSAGVKFGGQQRLAIHRLIDGGRLVEPMGSDDGSITWNGTFAGPEAVLRARGIDFFRTVGMPVLLTWDTFVYQVLVQRFEAAYESPWWIPYRIVCTVVIDEAAALVTDLLDIAGSIANDLAAAGNYGDTASLADLTLSGSGLTPSTESYMANSAAIASFQTSLQSSIASVGSTLQSLALPDAVTAAGTLAGLATTNAYVGRISSNLAAATT